MQRIETMTVSDGIVTAGVSAAVGWLASSFTKVSKTEFKELTTRVANLEKDRITREEFERTMGRIEESVREFRTEVKADLREIKAKV